MINQELCYLIIMLTFSLVLLTFLVFLLLFIFIFIRCFILITTVQGMSMSPTLFPGDRLIVLRYWPGRWLRKGQVVVGDLKKVLIKISGSKDETFLRSILGDSDKFVKRVIGLPGDTVVIHRSEINKEIQTILEMEFNIDNNLVWEIPTGFCFVRGDGLISGDSISWGPIPINYLIGIVLAKLPSKTNPTQHDLIETADENSTSAGST